ncbi:MAG: sensor histidine kinase [Patescibacteria group bacterium]
MEKLTEEQLKYKPYHDLFKIAFLPLISLLFFWVYFTNPPSTEILLSILLIWGIYSLITFFVLPIKYLNYHKFFIDIVFYTFFIILFIHFSGGAKSSFYPLLFLPVIASVACASLSIFFVILIISLAYYLVMIFLSSWYKIWFPLENSLINLFFIAIIGYLSFIVAEQIRQQFKILKEIDRAKMEFIATATHQLKAPLSSTKWIIEAILEGDLGKIDERQKEYFKQLHKSNERLIKFVNELLNVFKFEELHPKIEPKLVNLKELILKIISRFSPSIEKRNLKVEIKEEGEGWAIVSDRDLLDLIFDNLISNAIRYSFPGGKIFVYLKKIDNKIRVSIQDFGIGIPEKEQSKVFQKFFRAKNALRTETSGSGLGLYLAKKAVEKIGGKIWFFSKENKGTTFFVELPVKIYEPTKKE